MVIRITQPIQGGTVRAIASKSEAHRLLICAALADCETFIICRERSEDIDATARCLEALGAVIKYERGGFYVTPIELQKINEKIKHHTLDCGESGATLRFLLPVCGALGLTADFYMSGRLPARPLSPLYEEMVSHGCVLSGQGHSPLTCGGRLTNGEYNLPGNISSQYVSGLLFALPLLSGDSIIRVSGVLESRPYVDMTLDTMRRFGIKILEEEPNTFTVYGGQSCRSPKTARVEGDWSNAAFWLSAGAIAKIPVVCTGLDPESKQGDKLIVNLLSRFGANIACEKDFVRVFPGELAGIDIDAGDTPDLAPVLASVAAVAEGTTVIRNARRLRIKESDRLRAVTAVLRDLGADISETADGLIIRGKAKLTGGKTQSFGDHRLAMTAAVLSSACTGAVTIRGAEAVKKSYPDFFDDFSAALGGIWEEV